MPPVARCIKQFTTDGGRIKDRRSAPAVPFVRRYTRDDILLLAKVDTLHGTLSGSTTRKLCERAFKVHGEARFEGLAGISNGHLYNPAPPPDRPTRPNAARSTRPARPRSTSASASPFPMAAPAILRVDSVHQGDQDGCTATSRCAACRQSLKQVTN